MTFAGMPRWMRPPADAWPRGARRAAARAQLAKGPFSLAALLALSRVEAAKKAPGKPLAALPFAAPPARGEALRVGFLWTGTPPPPLLVLSGQVSSLTPY
jgi:hypothetical protein